VACLGIVASVLSKFVATNSGTTNSMVVRFLNAYKTSSRDGSVQACDLLMN
jgi:hypothetical protein